jgi:protein O-mannosyl-transferase
MTALKKNDPSSPGASGWARLRGFGACAGIFLATVAAYWPAFGAGFIWDDDGHVTRPALRSLHGLWRIWFEVGATQQYYPLLHSFFWLQQWIWRDAAPGYHVVNVLLHATAACLLVRVLRRLAVPGAWAAGLIYALHPVGVESVAWISEQKNTLSTVLYLMSALAYLGFRDRADDPGTARGRPAAAARMYALATAFFVMALLTKTVTATLPAALLVVAWWRNGRLSWRRDVLPLAPWFAIGASAGLLTAWFERTYIGAHGAHFGLSMIERCLLAGRVVGFYMGKLLWPANLIFIYPRWHVDARASWQYLYPAFVLALLAAAFLARKRSRGPLAALLLFIGSLFPALGFVDVYPFVFSYVADHFQYLADLGAIAALTAAATGLLGRWTDRPRMAAPVLLALLAAILGALTWRQARIYRDVEVFYRTVIERNPDSWLAEDNLGVVLAGQGRVPEAISHYEAALRLNSDYPQTYNNYANAMARQHRWPEAFAAYERALRLWPGFAAAEDNWGNALSDSGRYAEAAARFEDVLRHRADDAVAEYGLANALANSGRLDDAIGHYRSAVRLRPDYAEACANLGLALATVGRLPEARETLAMALRLRPTYAEAHAYLGLVLSREGKLDEAAGEYRAALRLNPNDRDVHYQLGLVLRALGQTADAAAEFEKAGSPRPF